MNPEPIIARYIILADPVGYGELVYVTDDCSNGRLLLFVESHDLVDALLPAISNYSILAAPTYLPAPCECFGKEFRLSANDDPMEYSRFPHRIMTSENEELVQNLNV
jgi:hypothetical protein